jgi:ABC-2 type transport system permease protein
VSTLAVYRTLLRASVTGQAAYRGSFALEIAGSWMVVLLDLVEVYAVFGQVPAVAGFAFAEVFLVFALASTAFSIADLLLGQTDRIMDHVRTGMFDVVLLRPLPALWQLAVSDLQLRRVGRMSFSVVVLVVALSRVDIAWTPARVVLLAVAPLSGAVVFAALFVISGALSFWLVEGREVGNAVTYGTGYLARWPLGIFGLPVRRLVTFVLPAAFTGYLPAVGLLGRAEPTGLPGWLPWAAPLAAAWAALAAGLLWRAGIRHYTGAGG